MEEVKDGEQPCVSEAEAVNTEEVKVADKTSGSLGKFKDTESLLLAYNNLQAEFTKKCQKLSELDKANKSPIYMSEDWNEKVAKFLENNKIASDFSAEIASEVLSDPSLAGEDKALDIAFARVMSGKYKEPEKAVHDEEFIKKYVLGSEEIRSRVIKEVLSQVKETPTIMNSIKGQAIGRHTPEKGAQSFAEARRIVKDMFS